MSRQTDHYYTLILLGTAALGGVLLALLFLLASGALHR